MTEQPLSKEEREQKIAVLKAMQAWGTDESPTLYHRWEDALQAAERREQRLRDALDGLEKVASGIANCWDEMDDDERNELKQLCAEARKALEGGQVMAKKKYVDPETLPGWRDEDGCACLIHVVQAALATDTAQS